MDSVEVQLATLSGQLNTVIAQMEAGDRQSAQLVSLVKDQLTYQAADIGEVKAVLRELTQKQESAINAVRLDLQAHIESVRVDLQKKIDTHTTDITDLRLWKSRIGGIAAASSLLGSVVSAVIVKAIGS